MSRELVQERSSLISLGGSLAVRRCDDGSMRVFKSDHQLGVIMLDHERPGPMRLQTRDLRVLAWLVACWWEQRQTDRISFELGALARELFRREPSATDRQEVFLSLIRLKGAVVNTGHAWENLLAAFQFHMEGDMAELRWGPSGNEAHWSPERVEAQLPRWLILPGQPAVYG